MALAHLPDRDREPSDRHAQETAGNDIADKMEVGADEADGDGGDADGVERAEPGIADPEHRHHGADGSRVPRGEPEISRSAVERVESKDAVANERRIVVHPGFRPG